MENDEFAKEIPNNNEFPEEKKKKEEGNGGRWQRDLRLEDKWSRGKRKEADGERGNEFIHGVQRGEIFEVSVCGKLHYDWQ